MEPGVETGGAEGLWLAERTCQDEDSSIGFVSRGSERIWIGFDWVVDRTCLATFFFFFLSSRQKKQSGRFFLFRPRCATGTCRLESATGQMGQSDR